MEIRKILFRGKRIDNGKWEYGSFCPDALELMERSTYLLDGYIQNYNAVSGKMTMHEVERETVGQYTGLDDKNGTKIFEGDIIKFNRWVYHGEYDKRLEVKIGVVRYDGGKCEFGIFGVKGYTRFLKLWRWQDDDNEVIGNIHDSPKLVEV